MLLEIKDLHASIEGKEILKGINLSVNEGEIHAIMGPNGSGKSTLAQVLAGMEEYKVTRGEVFFKGKNLLELAPEDRAREGIFLAFQYPVEIPGVSNTNMLKTAVNEIRKYKGEEEYDAMEFLQMIKSKMKLDRKSTRLNSSHLGISYAVFCLKKKMHGVCTFGTAAGLRTWIHRQSRTSPR